MLEVRDKFVKPFKVAELLESLCRIGSSPCQSASQQDSGGCVERGASAEAMVASKSLSRRRLRLIQAKKHSASQPSGPVLLTLPVPTPPRGSRVKAAPLGAPAVLGLDAAEHGSSLNVEGRMVFRKWNHRLNAAAISGVALADRTRSRRLS